MQPDAWPVAVVCGSLNLILALLLEKTNVFQNLREEQTVILLGFSTICSMFTVVFLLFNVITTVISALAFFGLYMLHKNVDALHGYLEAVFFLSVFGIFCGVAFRIMWLFVNP